jgi:gamma-glutamyl-gamma-aminobutyrate hydrolase PuuD
MREIVKVFLPGFFNDVSIAHRFFDSAWERSSLEDADIVIFAGGADISPEIYGQENHGQSFVNVVRDQKELNYLKEISDKNLNIKMLGICRGHQLLNAIFGGKLVQHIENSHPGIHELDNGLVVNSLHHQGVIVPGKGLEVIAKYNNEIEWSISEKVFSLQSHPEFPEFPDFSWEIVKRRFDVWMNQ